MSTVATDRLRWDAASLPAELLESIRQYETCTIADAIEHCGVRPRNEGFTRPGLCCLTQGSPRSLGYAATYRVRYPDRTDCWAPPETLPTPRIAIIEYLEKEPVGSVVGEVRVVILKAFSYEVDCATGLDMNLKQRIGTRVDTGYHRFRDGCVNWAQSEMSCGSGDPPHGPTVSGVGTPPWMREPAKCWHGRGSTAGAMCPRSA